MANLFDEGNQLIADEMIDNLSEAIVYYRGTASVSLYASVSLTVFEQLDNDGSVMIRTETADFIVKPGDLILNSLHVEPRRDDRIVRNVDGVEITYQVAAPEPEPPYKFCGTSRALMRIHTTKIRQE